MSPKKTKEKRNPKNREIRAKYKKQMTPDALKSVLKKLGGFGNTKQIVKAFGWNDLGYATVRTYTRPFAKKGLIKVVREKKNIIGYALPGATVSSKSTKPSAPKKAPAPKKSKPKPVTPVEAVPAPAPTVPAVS